MKPMLFPLLLSFVPLLWLLVACGVPPLQPTSDTDTEPLDTAPKADTCFVAGTEVATPGGPRPIDLLSVGDPVLSWDVDAGGTTIQHVPRVIEGSSEELWTVQAGRHRIEGVTSEHPFWSPVESRWVKAGALEVGDSVGVLQGDRLHTVTVDRVGPRWVPPTPVFTLTVDGPHDFFAEGLLVHNKSPDPGKAFVDLFVMAQFGFDALTQSPSPVDLVGQSIEPAYEIIIATANWDADFNNVEEYCYIVLTLGGATSADAAQADPRLYWGAQYEIGVDPPVTNCHEPGWELDEDLWGVDVVEGFVTTYGGPQFAAVGAPSPAVIKEVIAPLGADGEYVIGGAFGVPPVLGDVVEDVYGVAWTTDATLAVELDGDDQLVPLDPATVDLGGTLRTGWYDLTSNIYWSVQ